MHVLAHRRRLGHCREHGWREVGRIRRRETHAPDPDHAAHRAEQVGEIVLAVVIAVDGLAKQRDLRRAGAREVYDLMHDVGQLAAALRPARHRNDAEGAPIIAATLHRDERRDRIAADGVDVFVMFPSFELDVRRALATPGLRNQLGQATITVRADHQIDLRHTLEQFGAETLRHTAHHTQHVTWALVAFQLSHASQNPLLRVIAHRTGVHEQYVRLGGIVRAHVALTAQDAEHQLGVRDVHLAAVGLDVNAAHR